jgi:DNA-binding CsgD family transcriptional regulator
VALSVRLVIERDGANADVVAIVEAALTASAVVAVERHGEVRLVLPRRDDVPLTQADVPTLAVIDDAEHDRARELIVGGCRGVIGLGGVRSMLVPAIMAVRSGLVVVPAAEREAAVRSPLSLREKQVLGLVVMGMTNAGIARRLYLSESTVKYHLSSIYGKLGVRSRSEAAQLAVEGVPGLASGVVDMGGRVRRRRTGYRSPVVD